MSAFDAWVVMSGGPERVVHNEPDPAFVARPAGFAPPQTTATGVNGEQAILPHCVEEAQVEPKGAGRANATTASPPAPVAPPLLWEGDQA
jgi:hypothetical protein